MILSGVRVVELAAWVAGPAAGGVLADWGADVVKVEPPAGDPQRGVFSAIGANEQTAVPPFEVDNRGKRSIVLDLRSETGSAAMERLLERADVFITNTRVAALERLGLDHRAVRRRHPDLIYGIITGYGLEGPDAHRPGYDIGAFWARSSLASSVVPPGTLPPPIRSGLGDHVTGMTLAGGICGALFDRQRTGTWSPRLDEPAADGVVLGGVGLGGADALRAPGEHEVPRAVEDAARQLLRGGRRQRVLAARVGGRPALARCHGGDRSSRSGRRRAVRQRPVPRAARRRADRRVGRHVRGAADGRVGDALRRPRCLVGADQHGALRARRPAGRGVRSVRRHDAGRRRGAVPGRSPPRSTSTSRPTGRVRCRRSASTPRRSSPSSATAPPRSPPSRRPDRSPTRVFPAPEGVLRGSPAPHPRIPVPIRRRRHLRSVP